VKTPDPLVSATGSTRMGRRVGEARDQRLGRSLLEMGGNNAIIVAPSANMDWRCAGLCLRRWGRRTALHFDAPGFLRMNPLCRD